MRLGVLQGSVLSLLLFATVVDVLSENVKKLGCVMEPVVCRCHSFVE